jgi:hypothetical protein
LRVAVDAVQTVAVIDMQEVPETSPGGQLVIGDPGG